MTTGITGRINLLIGYTFIHFRQKPIYGRTMSKISTGASRINFPLNELSIKKWAWGPFGVSPTLKGLKLPCCFLRRKKNHRKFLLMEIKFILYFMCGF
jgi:hypothetical protein